MEYAQMSKFYDILYNKKNYKNEVEFLRSLFNTKTKTILDVGCGTGTHAKLLEEHGYIVDGIDSSAEMIDIAKQKCSGKFEKANLLTYSTTQKYDAIISMFAVFNHLKNHKQLENGIKNLLKILNINGIIIIDLHNPQKNGQKQDVVNNISRTMKWRVCRLLNKEFSKISYTYNNQTFNTKHTFKIFNIIKLKKIATKLNCNVEMFENYTKTPATKRSKNIQLIIKKLK